MHPAPLTHLTTFALGVCSDASGHFTAIVWQSVKSIGCATTWCTNMAADGQLWTGRFFVCNYYPPGNVDSAEEFRENVLPHNPAVQWGK